MRLSTMQVLCPTCRCPVAWLPENKFKPFCSERCRLIDLGEWIMEEKRIAGETIDSVSDDFDESAFLH
jgi:endogenous inhibitor of DNA gyrase (YacG/DUF329 family)